MHEEEYVPEAKKIVENRIPEILDKISRKRREYKQTNDWNKDDKRGS